MVMIGSYSGFGLIRPLTDGRVKLDWKPKFVAIESGILLWYLDEMSVQAEGAVGIMKAPEVLPTPLITGERVIRISQGKDQAGNVVQLDFAVNPEEVDIWEGVLSRHVAVCTEYGSLGEIRGERSLEEEMAAMVWSEEESDMTISVHVNGEQFPLHISPKETDMHLRSIEFIEEHGLKGVIAPKVEMELLRAQSKLLAEREQHYRKHIGRNHRKLHGIVIAEAHAALAENCAAALSSSLKQVKEEVVPKLQEAISELKADLLKKEALYNEEKRLREDDKAEWDLGNAIHVQNYEALKRELDKAKYDGDVAKKERDRFHQTILSESKTKEGAGTGRERDGRGEAANSMPYSSPSGDESSAHRPLHHERVQGEIVELRKDKRELTQALKDAQNKAKILQYELSDAYGQKSLQRKAVVGSPTSTSALELDEVKLKYYSAREQAVLHKQKISSLEVKNGALEKKVGLLETKIEGLEDAKKALFQEHQFDKEQLHLLRSTASVNNASNMLKENRNLREQLLKFRGEGVRLQLRIDELLQRTRTALEDLSEQAGVQINVAAMMGTITVASNASEEPAAPLTMEGADPSSSDEAKSSTSDAPPASPSKKLPFSEEALPRHSASSQLSPIIEERMMKLCFHRYLPSESTPVQGVSNNSASRQNVRAAMTMQRFLRFAKDFNMCYIGSPGSAGPCRPPFLSPGEVEMIFVNSARSDGEQHEPEKLTKKPFAYRGGAGTLKMYSKDYKHGQSTGLTINFQQFRKALMELACALYGDLVLDETGAELDCLPKQQRSRAALAVFDVLFKKKLLPVCGKLSLVPWSLIHVNQTIAILEEYPAVSYYITDNILGEILRWYEFYSVGGISYKKISKFAHDFGMIPFILNEPALYSMYQEILLWVRRMEDVVERCTPDGVEDADPDLGCSKKSSSKTKKDYSTMVLNHLELPEPAKADDRISFRDFVLLFASISTMAFNDASPETRLSRLFDVAKVSGGHVMISRGSES